MEAHNIVTARKPKRGSTHKDVVLGHAPKAASIVGVLLTMLLLPAVPVIAQDDLGIVAGSFTIKPKLGLTARQNDNIYTLSEDPIDSLIFLQAPELALEYEPGRQKFVLRYEGEFAQYDENPIDDYADQRLFAQAVMKLGLRHSFDLKGWIFDAHEDRGSGLSRGLTPESPNFPVEPIEFEDRNAELTYGFGARGAKGRLELYAAQVSKEYTNNLEFTAVQNRTKDSAGAAFFYGFRKDSYLVFDVLTREVEYDTDPANQASRNGSEDRYRLGVTWELTGKTTGRISIGSVSKDFEDSRRPDFSGVSWEVNVRWSPKSHYYFDFLTSREPRETIANGDFIDAKRYQVVWNHNWNQSLNSEVSFTLRDENFVGTPRSETLRDFTVDFGYQVRRWLTLKAGVVIRSNDSTIDNLLYDTNIYQLGFELAI